MRKIALLLLASTMLFGCATEWNSHYDSGLDTSYNHYQVRIVSEPPGAIIEWNEGLLGKAPITKVLNGTVGHYWQDTVRATPDGTSGCTNTKVIDHPIPRTLYFNTKLCPVGSMNEVVR